MVQPRQNRSRKHAYTLDGIVVFFNLLFIKSFVILVVSTINVEFNGFV